jgi:hypothetical protein
MSRWVLFFITIALGIAAGLYFGWVIDPVEYVDTSPSSLRADYKADYVLMIAEAYQTDGDLDLAARRLIPLGDDLPTESATKAIIFATTVQPPYAPEDLALMQTLAKDLQGWSPPAVTPNP